MMQARTLLSTIVFGAGLLGLSVPFAMAQTGTIKVGVIAPLTGPGAAWGVAMQQDAKMLQDDANAAGGLEIGGKKYKVSFTVYDDQYKASEAVAAYNRLLNQDGVKYVVILTSASTFALKESIKNDKIVAMTTSISPAAVENADGYLTRMISIPAEYVPPFVSWMKEHLPERRVALINPNDETGWANSKADETALKANGYQIVANELTERTQRDFQPLLTKFVQGGADLIGLGALPPATAGLVVRQARELGYKGRFFKTSGPGPEEILTAAGSKAAVEGLIAMSYTDPGSDGYKQLSTRYRAAVGQEPNLMLAPYYDGMKVLLRAVQQAGNVDDAAKILAAMPAVLPMRSISGGNLTMGQRAFVTPIYVTEMKDGVATIVGSVLN